MDQGTGGALLLLLVGLALVGLGWFLASRRVRIIASSSLPVITVASQNKALAASLEFALAVQAAVRDRAAKPPTP